MIFFSHRPQIHKLRYLCTRNFTNDLFYTLYPIFYTFYPYVLTLRTHEFYFFAIHHCKNSHHSSLHIFVHPCTLCASWHVKTSPGYKTVQSTNHSHSCIHITTKGFVRNPHVLT